MHAPLGRWQRHRRHPQRRQARRPPPPRPRPARPLAPAAAPASGAAQIHWRAAAAATGSPRRHGQQCPRQKRRCLGDAHRNAHGVSLTLGSKIVQAITAPTLCFNAQQAHLAQQEARRSKAPGRRSSGDTQVWPAAAARAASSTAWLGRSSTPCSCASAPPALSPKPPRPAC